MKIYVTKNCLTYGIQELEGGDFHKNFFNGAWFSTREEAVADANHRRELEIEKLKRDILMLRAMKF